VPKIIKIELGLTKLLQKLKWGSFFDSHGIITAFNNIHFILFYFTQTDFAKITNSI